MAQQQDSGSHHGISVHSNCHNAIDKMSAAYAFLYHNTIYHNTIYHNHSAPMVHCVHNVDISIALAQLKPVAIKGEHLPTEVGYDTKLQSGQDPGVEDEHVD